MNVKRALMAVASVMLAMTLYSGAYANNGVEKEEFTFTWSDYYVACLDELVTSHVMVTLKSREFDTPSGIYHKVENWQYTWVITGQSSGNVWIGHGAAPYTELWYGPGGTLQFGENFVAIPVSGDGPKIREHYRFKATRNANGVRVVLIRDNLGVPPEDWWECFGEGKQ